MTDALPFLDARALWHRIGIDANFSELRRLAGVSPAHFDAMYLPAIVRFSERVQLAPASMSHHHAYAGGLLKHSIDVVKNAMTLRKGYHLPIGAEPEIVNRLEHLYSYGVFVVALLHDAGKALVNVRFVSPQNKQVWHPLGFSHRDAGMTHYQLEFVYPLPYKLHQQIAASVFSWIPPIARAWLGQEPILLGEVLAALYGDYLDAGVFAEILQRADGQSVADDLQLDTSGEQRFSTPLIPPQQRIKNALRQVFENNLLRLNAAGAHGWVDETGEAMYLVCRPTATVIVEQAQAEGVMSLPTDAGRLYDMLQDYGLVEPTPEGKAVWRVHVHKDNFSHTLTCLKFPVRSYFTPNRMPKPWDGTVRALAEGEDVEPTIEAQPVAGTENPENDTAGTAPDSHHDAGTASDENSYYETNPYGNDGYDDALDKALYGDTEPLITPNKPVAATTTQATGTASSHNAQRAGAAHREHSAGATTDSSVPGGTVDTGDKKATGRRFLHWIKQGIADGDLKFNKSSAAIHVVPDGVLLVSPSIFKKFCQQHTIVNHTDSKSDFWAVQKGLESLKIHKRTSTRLNIWSFGVVNKQGNQVARLQGYLLPISEVFDKTQYPEPNKFLQQIVPLNMT